jgi:hypothetical protein
MRASWSDVRDSVPSWNRETHGVPPGNRAAPRLRVATSTNQRRPGRIVANRVSRPLETDESSQRRSRRRAEVEGALGAAFKWKECITPKRAGRPTAFQPHRRTSREILAWSPAVDEARRLRKSSRPGRLVRGVHHGLHSALVRSADPSARIPASSLPGQASSKVSMAPTNFPSGLTSRRTTMLGAAGPVLRTAGALRPDQSCSSTASASGVQRTTRRVVRGGSESVMRPPDPSGGLGAAHRKADQGDASLRAGNPA